MHHFSRNALALFSVLTLVACGRAGGEQYDLLIAGGQVIDGTGASAFRADIGLLGDRIIRISRSSLPHDAAREVIDATGLMVAPGFIDLHSHNDDLLLRPSAENFVRQGVTTFLGGPDGHGPMPFGPYLDSVAQTQIGINVAYLVGHNAIRTAVLAADDREPTPGELDQMRQIVADAMHEGAYGLSSGLAYLPGLFAKADEVIALAIVAGDSGGIYASHIRDEGPGLFAGVGETLDVGSRAEIPVILTHHKALGQLNWGRSTETLAMVDSARKAGVDAMLDVYPYTASSGPLSVYFPRWSLDGGVNGLATRLESPELRDSIARGVLERIRDAQGGGDLRRMQFARVAWDPELQGLTFYDWAVSRGLEPTLENGAQLALEAQTNGGVGLVNHNLEQADVDRVMRHPQTMIASDGALVEMGAGTPHPRSYGAFPRILGHYVRERSVLSLEEAIHKMTAMPAERLGVTDRGRLVEGSYADLVIFDPALVADRATFESPHQYPVGIGYVVVNGSLVIREDTLTSARPGRLLRHVPTP